MAVMPPASAIQTTASKNFLFMETSHDSFGAASTKVEVQTAELLAR